jgi:hypothetical protein
LGLVNLGDGAIKFSANDVGLFQMAVGVDACRLQKPFQRLACREWFGIERELTQPDRREVDAAIFDALGLESNEREELYDATARLVRRRLAKADAAHR